MFSAIDKYNTDQKIITDTVAQVNKDMGTLLEKPAELTGSDTPYNELFGILLPVVDSLLGNNKSRLLQLLYRIDLPGKFMKNIPTTRANAAAYITNGILERELQKVVIRHNLGTGE